MSETTCDELVDSAGYYYVEQGKEPEILNGLGTMGLEILDDLPDVDVIICPIGGGSGCASLVKVAQAVNPKVEVIGVQLERAAAFYESWKKGERVRLEPADSVADGLAARSVFQLPYVIMKDHITDVVLLSEEEIVKGIRLAIETTHNLAEGAGAAALAAAVKIKDRLAGKKVARALPGRLPDPGQLAAAPHRGARVGDAQGLRPHPRPRRERRDRAHPLPGARRPRGRGLGGPPRRPRPLPRPDPRAAPLRLDGVRDRVRPRAVRGGLAAGGGLGRRPVRPVRA